MLTHSGEKPFKCDQCNYSSTKGDNLKVHKRTHTGEEPYTCNQCSFSSKDSGNLQKHIARKHREQPNAWNYHLFTLNDIILLVYFLTIVDDAFQCYGFYVFWSIFMVFQGIFMASHGFWLVFMIFKSIFMVVHVV